MIIILEYPSFHKTPPVNRRGFCLPCEVRHRRTKEGFARLNLKEIWAGLPIVIPSAVDDRGFTRLARHFNRFPVRPLRVRPGMTLQNFIFS